MRTRHLAGGTALSVLLATASLLGVTATPAAADSDIALPISSYSDMVVDGLHQRVFISSSANSKIVVTDYHGTVVGTIQSEPGAAGLVLSADSATLYVAVPDGDAISAIDTATLKETARYPIGAGTAPRYLAMNRDTIWFGYGDAMHGNLGSLDLDPGTPTDDPAGTPGSAGTVTADGAVVTLGQGGGHSWYSAPMVASSPGNPDALAAGAPDQSPIELQVYDVSSGHAESKAYRFGPNNASNLQDLTVTPDGTQILAASGAPYFQQVYRTSDLSSDGRYTTNPYPNSVAVAPDGTVAAGIFGWYQPDVYIFRPQVDEPVRTYEFPNTGHSSGSDTLAPGGLAWTPDAGRLFAVSSNDAGVYSLRVLQDPTKAATRLTVDAPATAVPGDEVTVRGTLDSATPLPAGTEVTATRNGIALGTTTTNPDGSFSFQDTPTALGSTTYRVTFAGDATHAATEATATVNVAKAATRLTVDAPATAVPGDEVTVRGTLDSATPLPAGTEVTATRNGIALGTTATNADGSFSFQDTPTALGNTTYTVTYAGDTVHAATEASAVVDVEKDAATVVLSAPTTALPGAEVTVRGTLVSDTPLPAGTEVTATRNGTPLGTTTTNPDGSFAFEDHPTALGNTTYRVSFAGDATHAPSTSSAVVDVEKAPATLTVGAPATAKRATKITVTGKLASSAAFPAGVKVAVTRTDLTDPKGRSLGTKSVAPNGTFSFTDTPVTGGTVTYTATYAGDGTHTPATGKDTVAVSRLATSVGIKTNLSTYAYGSTATVTGHLGKTGKSRVVSIWAQPAGGTKKLVKTGTVNSAGDLRITYKLSRNTTFWASFGGDFSYAPKSVSRAVGTQVKLSTSVSSHYKTGRIGSTTYYWFHKKTAPHFTTSMTYQTGRAGHFELQVYYQGRWYTQDSEYFGLEHDGSLRVRLDAPGQAGVRARVRFSYVKGGSHDSLNTTTLGAWKYLYFTN